MAPLVAQFPEKGSLVIQKISPVKKWFKSNKVYFLAALIGAIGGYLYYQQIGCSSGTCMITSKPVNSTLYGAFMGALLFGTFKKGNKKPTLSEEDKIKP